MRLAALRIWVTGGQGANADRVHVDLDRLPRDPLRRLEQGSLSSPLVAIGLPIWIVEFPRFG